MRSLAVRGHSAANRMRKLTPRIMRTATATGPRPPNKCANPDSSVAHAQSSSGGQGGGPQRLQGRHALPQAPPCRRYPLAGTDPTRTPRELGHTLQREHRVPQPAANPCPLRPAGALRCALPDDAGATTQAARPAAAPPRGSACTSGGQQTRAPRPQPALIHAAAWSHRAWALH